MRAEYSAGDFSLMLTLAIALVVAGAALAALGVLRLTHASFPTLPSGLAFAIITTGVFVVAFGALLPHFAGQRERARITLERQSEGATPGPVPHGDLRGIVRSVDGRGVGGVKIALVRGIERPRSTTTDQEGNYVFRDVPAGGPYRVIASYAGAVFQRVVVVPTSPVSITVAQTTNKPSNVIVRAASAAIVGDERGVQVVYAATLENSGRNAYSGGVPLPVLPGATGVDPRDGIDRSQLAVQDGVLFSSAPLPPGPTAISYTYVAPISTRGIDVAVDTAFPTRRFDLLVGGKLRGDAVHRANGTVRLGDRTYHRFTWRGLHAGDTVTARIAPSTTSPVLRTAAVAAGGVIAAFIVAFPLVRRRRGVVPVSAPAAAQ